MNGRQWALHSSLDDGNATLSQLAASSSEPANGIAAARALFQSKASRGQDKVAGNSSSQASVSLHSRAITGISVAAGNQTIVTTSSLDGKTILWDLQSVMLGINASTMGLQ